MFGFATKRDLNRWIAKANKEINDEMVARYQHIRADLMERLENEFKSKAKAETPQAPEPVETNGKLWTITISKDGAPHPERYVWNDCTRYDWECYFDGTVSGINILFKNGATVYKVGRWNVEMTEQKPEGEKASFANGGVSFLSQIDRHLDRLLDQPVNVRSLTLAREELERKMAKNHDALNHRIEMLELRLDKTDSVKKPNRKPKSK